MGRVREFNSDVVLDHALAVFWKKGYEATSIQDLVSATGLNRSSLYQTFGDKQTLFRLVMARYGETKNVAHTTLSAKPGLARIRAALEGAGEEASSDPRGCLIVNAIVERGAQDGAMRSEGKQARQQLEAFFRDCLEAAEKQEEIRTGQDLGLLARFLTNSLFGLRVMSKTLANPEELRALVNRTLTFIE